MLIAYQAVAPGNAGLNANPVTHLPPAPAAPPAYDDRNELEQLILQVEGTPENQNALRAIRDRIDEIATPLQPAWNEFVGQLPPNANYDVFNTILERTSPGQPLAMVSLAQVARADAATIQAIDMNLNNNNWNYQNDLQPVTNHEHLTEINQLITDLKALASANPWNSPYGLNEQLRALIYAFPDPNRT